MTLKCVTKEWEKFQNYPLENIFAESIDNNMFHWGGKIL
jgi:hypothetical protein